MGSAKAIKVLALCFISAYIIFLFYITIHKHYFFKFGRGRNAYSSSKNSFAASKSQHVVVILLQQSPVDQKNRINRLKAIDNSWADWINKNYQFSANEMKIFAVMNPQEASGNSFKNIQPLFLDELNYIKLSPYKNIINSFLTLMTTVSNVKFIIYGNDHTFFIPANLLCYLDSLNKEHALYAGNKLNRGDFKGYDLDFASGGAGVIISHVALKMFLFALILNHDDIFDEILQLQSYCGKKQVLFDTNLTSNNQNEMRNENQNSKVQLFSSTNEDMSNSLCYLREWNHNDQFSSAINPVIMYLSSEQSLRVMKLSSAFTTTVAVDIISSQDGSIITPIDKKKLQKCHASSEWDRINPGLVVAYCLQAVFNVPFTAAVDEQGKDHFNAYGAMRSLHGDVDGWYIESKLKLPPGALDNAKLREKHHYPTRMSTVSNQLISFHYVSQFEANLLYRLLTKQLKPSNWIEFQQLWPKTNQEAGHYSRSHFYNEDEIKHLYDYIMRNVTIPYCDH